MAFISTLRTIQKDALSEISFEAASSLLQLTWVQHPSSEQYRHGYEQAIGIAQEHDIRYWLTDSRKVPFMHLADQHWMYATMIPMLTRGELSKFALVLQPEAFMMTDKEPILNNEGGNSTPEVINIDFFLDLETARYWLLKDRVQE